MDIAIQFDNTRFFEKSVNWRMKDAPDFKQKGRRRQFSVSLQMNRTWYIFAMVHEKEIPRL
ncbi:MAG: hypothetical protein BA872_02310 [Desulfobacterales bacterium C00003060]|nr:MAG: hypothetical protein BA872_02310 [Desulfobacterales bacterium C00003060]